ncbi:MAG: RNA polymerase factor sigma-32 [Verrucomicrobiales bacterium]|nr:RNA polymerase factor sigma-32 [Verrucomicrobiales bacterium]|tara:strand:- start:7172 stop:8068 length:897 start_codon:yes stop_codon:yes gene_type:complete
MTAEKINYFPSSDTLNDYIRQTQKFPMLEPEEEYTLAKQWVENEDKEARKKLIESHLRLVVKIASGYRGYGLPLSDLIAEGNLGLLQATNKFDPEMGNRFSTYAQWWIKAAIQDYVLKSWSLVKIGTTAAQKKLFFGLKKIKHVLKIRDDGDLLDEHAEKIAAELDVPIAEVKSMQQRIQSHDSSLNKPIKEEAGAGEWQDWLESEDYNQEENLISSTDQNKKSELVHEAIKVLNPREKQIVIARKLEEPPKKLEELATHYQLSKERVRQIELKAMHKLHHFLENHLKDNENLRYLVE